MVRTAATTTPRAERRAGARAREQNATTTRHRPALPRLIVNREPRDIPVVYRGSSNTLASRLP